MKNEEKNGGGWIKVHRKLAENEVWLEKPFSRGQAWVDLLLLATFKNRNVTKKRTTIRLGSGDLVFIIREIAERWGWSTTSIYRFLLELENKGQILRRTEGNKTVISVLNFTIYQGGVYEQNTANNKEKNFSEDRGGTKTLKKRNKNVKKTEQKLEQKRMAKTSECSHKKIYEDECFGTKNGTKTMKKRNKNVEKVEHPIYNTVEERYKEGIKNDHNLENPSGFSGLTEIKKIKASNPNGTVLPPQPPPHGELRTVANISQENSVYEGEVTKISQKELKKEKKANEVNLFLSAFRKINPGVQFGHKVNRTNVERIISSLGSLDECYAFIDFAIIHRGDKFFPDVSTPAKFLWGLGRLTDLMVQYRKKSAANDFLDPLLRALKEEQERDIMLGNTK